MPAPRTKVSKIDLRETAEADLLAFIRLVSPNRVLGPVHEDLITWWTRTDAKSHQLTLLPRDHQKSAMIAYRVAWEITKNPAIRVLYISSTSNLAEKQLKMIKDILTSTRYRAFWPEMVHAEEGKREKWTNSEMSIDHPKRREEGVRDPTVFTGGLTTSLTGLHCDIAVLDDVVVQENAYTEDGREKVRQQYSLLASIESTDSKEWVVGTRYHPLDLYHDLMEMEEEEYDADGEVVSTTPVYEIFERTVEDAGDGTGRYIWPRIARTSDGKVFGFDARILARKRAQYLDKSQFYSQYYNDPNHSSTGPIQSNYFQYYDVGHVKRDKGKWFVQGQQLNISASMDFAYTVKTRSDYTCIAVVGASADGNYYILDIDRFRVDKMGEMFERLRAMHNRWQFHKIRMECSAAQGALVRELKDSYIRPFGLALSIEEYYPTRKEGTKEERIEAILRPRYENKSIWHFRGGHCSTLEQELVLEHPPHDDVKDAVASAVETCVIPRSADWRQQFKVVNGGSASSRFGGAL